MSDEVKTPTESEKLEALQKEVEELKKANEQLKAKDLKPEDKLDELVKEKFEEYKKKDLSRIEEARRLIAEAEENEKLEKELRENEKFQTKTQIRERKEKLLVQEFEKLKNMIHNRQHFPDLFDSSYRTEKVTEIRKLAYALEVLGPEKLVENFKKNLSTVKRY